MRLSSVIASLAAFMLLASASPIGKTIQKRAGEKSMDGESITTYHDPQTGICASATSNANTVANLHSEASDPITGYTLHHSDDPSAGMSTYRINDPCKKRTTTANRNHRTGSISYETTDHDTGLTTPLNGPTTTSHQTHDPVALTHATFNELGQLHRAAIAKSGGGNTGGDGRTGKAAQDKSHRRR